MIYYQLMFTMNAKLKMKDYMSSHAITCHNEFWSCNWLSKKLSTIQSSPQIHVIVYILINFSITKSQLLRFS